MNILFDNLIFSLQKAGGISVVWENLLANCFGHADIRCIEYPGVDANLSRKNLKIPSEIIMAKSLKPKLAELINPKVSYHGNEKFIFHSSYFRTCSHPKAINVTTVHDFIYEQGKTTLKQKIRIDLNYRAIRKSDAIICISENTKRDLLKYVSDIDPAKISVIYNGVSDSYQKLDVVPYPKYNNHVLFVGGRNGYKNFQFTVKALSGTNYHLLVCGKAIDVKEEELLEYYMPNQYTIISFPSNEELNKIYNSVFALVYPSSYEGFGIPILEAQRTHCPVIALKSSSVPEVAGDGAILLDELTKDNLIDALDSLNDSSITSSLREKGYINSQRFSWNKMADNYLKLYKKVLDQESN